jgi:hypothetical protein
MSKPPFVDEHGVVPIAPPPNVCENQSTGPAGRR